MLSEIKDEMNDSEVPVRDYTIEIDFISQRFSIFVTKIT
jgi:hypothetical protein